MFRLARSLNSSRFIGPGAFDPQLVATFAFISFSLSLLLTSVFTGTQPLASMVIFHGVVHLVLFGLLGLLGAALRRPLAAGKVTFLHMISIGALFGLGRLLVTAIGLTIFGLELGFWPAVAERLWQSLFYGMFALPLIGFLGSLRARSVLARDQLITQRVVNQAKNIDDNVEILEFVESAREQLRAEGSVVNTSALAAEVQRIVDEELRPLSHKLWSRENKKIPGYKARDIFWVALSDHIYRPQIAIPLLFISIVAPNIAIFGPREGVVISAVRSVILLFGLVLAGFIRVKGRFALGAKFVVAFPTIYGLQTLVARWSIEVSNEPLVAGVFLAGLVWTLQILVFVAMVWALLDLGTKVKSQLKAEYDLSEIELLDTSKLALLRDRKIAQFMHGQLQGQLVKASIQLSESSDTASVEEALDLIEAVLDGAVQDFLALPQDLAQVKAKLHESWAELVSIEFRDSALEGDPTPAQLSKIQDTATEAISNAVRHGLASKVVIEIAQLSQNILLTATDDGVGPRQGEPGLGSIYLDTISSQWSLGQGDPGSLLQVLIEE
jgi:signal transduction histidine kinase